MAKEILVNANEREIRAAVIDGGRLDEYFVERPGDEKIVGNIYKGKVSSIVKGMGAAFVNIGYKRNGFLFVSDIVAPPDELKAVLENGELTKALSKSKSAKRIDEILRKNQELILQVVKEPVGRKGPRLTAQISLPGRYLVLMPCSGHFGVSKKIRKEDERRRLKEILSELKRPKDMGIIVRTVSEGKSKQELQRDFKYLMSRWRQIKTLASKKDAPTLLHKEDDLTFRLVRDYLTHDVKELIVDRKTEHHLIERNIKAIVPDFIKKLKFYKNGDTVPLFEKFQIDAHIETLYERKVPLKSGGYLIIEPTEGLIAIDVNTGSFTGKKNLEDTVFETNMEAAKEIARQVRLRDLGGIIIIDFIDMMSREHRRRIFEVFESSLAKDKAKKNILPISEIGVVEMTRQRIRKNIASVYYMECSYCRGKGLIKSAMTMNIEIFKQINRFLKQRVRPRRFGRKYQLKVYLHPDLVEYVQENDAAAIKRIERTYKVKVLLTPQESKHYEDIEISLIK